GSSDITASAAARDGTPKGLGGVMHQTAVQHPEAQPTSMGKRDLLALEAQLVLIPMGGRRIRCAPTGCTAGGLAVQITQLTVIIVVDLAATLKVQGKIMVFMRSEGEAGTNRVVTAFHRR